MEDDDEIIEAINSLTEQEIELLIYLLKGGNNASLQRQGKD